jgi:hypothetical protein
MLHAITKVVDSHPKLTPKKINYFKSKLGKPLDSYPITLDTYENMLSKGLLKRGQSYHLLIKVSTLFADDIYNRIDELNLTKVMENLEKLKGFSYGSANTLVAYLRPDGRLVLTQGNHRAAMCYLTLGPDAYVVVNVIVHDAETIEDCIKIEAINFTTDNNLRWNMIAKHKFKGNLKAGLPEAIQLYDFVKPFGVSIADTNRDDYVSTHTFESYGNLLEALSIDDTRDKQYVKNALESLTSHLKAEKDIRGFVFVGLVLFQKVFKTRLDKIESHNRLICSFDDFIKYIFEERRMFNGSGPITTQQDVVEDSGGIKVREFFASRFVVLYNEYCFNRGVDFKRGGLKGNCAIPETCDEWKALVENLSPVKMRLLSAERF